MAQQEVIIRQAATLAVKNIVPPDWHVPPEAMQFLKDEEKKTPSRKKKKQAKHSPRETQSFRVYKNKRKDSPRNNPYGLRNASSGEESDGGTKDPTSPGLSDVVNSRRFVSFTSYNFYSYFFFVQNVLTQLREQLIIMNLL